jgi:hypothetical protein
MHRLPFAASKGFYLHSIQSFQLGFDRCDQKLSSQRRLFEAWFQGVKVLIELPSVGLIAASRAYVDASAM